MRLGASERKDRGHEFQIYRVEFEMPLGNPRGCSQEINYDIRLDFWRELGSRNLYLEIISV